MARRRMISNDITGSYNFQSMEHTTQLLYFYFCLSADDDGFIGNPYIYTNLTGCSENDLETLERRGYVIRLSTRRSWRSCGSRTSAMSARLSRKRSGTKTEPKRNRSIVKSSIVKSSPVKSSPVKPS